MPHDVQLSLKLADRDAKVELVASLPESDWEILESYLGYVAQLGEAEYIKSGMPLSLRVTWNQTEGLTASGDFPAWDSVVVVLHRLRPLILTSEHASFDRTCGVLGRHFRDPGFKAILSEIRQLYDGRVLQRQIQLTSADLILNSEKVLMDWLNSYEYHRDQDKKALVDRLFRMMPVDISRAVMLLLVVGKVEAIRSLGGLVELVQGKRRDFEATIPRDYSGA